MRSSRVLVLGLFLGLLTTGLMAPTAAHAASISAPVLTSVTASAASAAGEPALRRRVRDFPNIPRHCYDKAKPTAPRPQACRINHFNAKRPSLVLWGDSHAQEYLPSLRQAVRGRGINLVSFVSGGCPPAWVPKSNKPYPNCEASNRAALDWIKARRDAGMRVTVVVSSQWSAWRRYYGELKADERAGRPPRYSEYFQRIVRLAHRGIPRMFDALGRLGVRVDVVDVSGIYPAEGKPACPQGEEPYRCTLPRKQVIETEATTALFLREQMKKLSGPHHLIDTSTAYCSSRECFGTVDGLPTFYDKDHLSKTFTKTLSGYFAATASRAAGRR